MILSKIPLRIDTNTRHTYGFPFARCDRDEIFQETEMRRLFSTMMIGMFAFGFCVGVVGCGEGDDAAADDKTEAKDEKAE